MFGENFPLGSMGDERRVKRAQTRTRGPPSALGEFSCILTHEICSYNDNRVRENKKKNKKAKIKRKAKKVEDEREREQQLKQYQRIMKSGQ